MGLSYYRLLLTILTAFGLPLFVGNLAATFSPLHAQGTAADYERVRQWPERLRPAARDERPVFTWLEQPPMVAFEKVDSSGSVRYWLVDINRAVREPLFDGPALAAALTEALGVEIGIETLRLQALGLESAQQFRFQFQDQPWSYDRSTNRLSSGKREAGRMPTPGPSVPSETHLDITIHNRLAIRLQLYWIDYQGRRRPYGQIGPGQSHSQSTFVGHVWEIRDASSRRRVRFVADESQPEFTVDDSHLVVEEPAAHQNFLDSGNVLQAPRAESPDGKWTAAIVEHNIVLRDSTGVQRSVSTDGSAERPYDNRFWWSPDSRRLVALQSTAARARQVHMVESSPNDQLQPRLHVHDYVKPGDEIAQPQPKLIDIELGITRGVPERAWENAWSLDFVHWFPDSSCFAYLHQRRGHQVQRLWRVPADPTEVVLDSDGLIKPALLFEEQSKTFIDYAHKTYLHWLDDTDELIWSSERSGWNHLYLLDSRTGQVKNPITAGNWVVRKVESVDAIRRELCLRVMGVKPEQDPYHQHYARVGFDGSGFRLLTAADGDHRVEFSADREYIVDTWSRVDQPAVSELRRANDGSMIMELARDDCQQLEQLGWKSPERLAFKGRDGVTDIYGVIHRPSNFEAGRKYPIIELVYAGPQDFYAPKSFRAIHGVYRLTELGFIVVQVDGMGTNWRSKAFHDVCARNLADAGFADRIAWLRAAAERYQEFDLTRVGIYGGSAGGQSAVRALIAHHDFYRAAAADCGCHDNRMDKNWWNELWMGWPLGSHYAEQSNVTNAQQLEGALLLSVGELDRNVDPASTMQLVNALIKADKDFELIVVPGSDHGAGESAYAVRRRQDFFVRQLMGVEPRRR